MPLPTAYIYIWYNIIAHLIGTSKENPILFMLIAITLLLVIVTGFFSIIIQYIHPSHRNRSSSQTARVCVCSSDRPFICIHTCIPRLCHYYCYYYIYMYRHHLHSIYHLKTHWTACVCVPIRISQQCIFLSLSMKICRKMFLYCTVFDELL